MRILLALLTLLMAAPAATALAQTAAATEIVVSGNGSVTLPPDQATVSASIQTNAENAADAVGRNNAIYDRVVAALAKAGIARADVSLASYNVNYNPKPRVLPSPPEDVQYGYTVMRDFTVKVRDIEKAGAVADACSGSGATSIGGVSFGLADPHAAQAQATARAVDEAKAKAEALAAAAGLRLSGIKSITLNNGGGGVYPLMRMAAAMPAPAPATAFDAANVTVSVNVEMTFLAKP